MIPIHVGQKLGNYRLVRLLGRDDFTEVYLGEHIYLKNYAVVKVLLTSLNDKEEMQQFLSEAQTLARLTHPNIVQVREFAVERGIPFLVMDYAPGGTLRQCYPKGSSLSLEDTVATIKQVAVALQYAHNHNIIHRDVKPENLLLDAQENVQLSDFGFSLFSSHTEQEMAGALTYMAPEQQAGKACFASDQYSLAVIAYEWLCGVPPFEGPSLSEHHAHTPPPSLREKDPSLPKTVEAVILKALAKDPKDRYVSVLLFARALEQAWITIPDSPSDLSTVSLPIYPQGALVSVPERIFLSATFNDNTFAAQFKTDIEQRGITVESTTSQIESEEEQARRTIRAAQMVLLVISPHTRTSPAIKTHLTIAELYRRPVLCIWIAGDNPEELLPNVRATQNANVIDARPTNYRQALDVIITTVLREINPTPIQPLQELDAKPRNPYKGLHAFMQEDAKDFFGRDTLVQEMVQLVENALMPVSLPDQTGKRLLTVIGPSGSGKSSAVMAGLLPRLQQGALPSSETWIYLDPMVPGSHPLDALAYVLLSRFTGRSMQDLRDTLTIDGSQGLHKLVTSLALHSKSSRVVLLIDQFEELFSPEVTEKERQQTIDLLLTAVSEPEGPLVILLTLRADFYDRPLAYPALGRLVQQQQCTVLPMELEDLRATIEQPTTLPDVWLTFDEDLVGDLLFEVQGQAGALPLLQFTLDQLFECREGHHLTRNSYQEIGGVKGALSRQAETTYTNLPSDEHRRLAQVLLLRLLHNNSAGQEPGRRRAKLTEFTFENTTQTQYMQETIDAFLAARLLTTNQVAGVVTLEVSHETLLQEWPRLRNWIRDAREDIHLQQILSGDVAEWEKRGRPKDRLYPRSRIKEFKPWQERNLASKQEVDFLKASMKRQNRVRIRTLLVVLFVLSLLFPTAIYFMPTIFSRSVTNLNDSGLGSLRHAIESAQSGDTITIDPNLRGTIRLSTSLIITKDLTIEGSDPRALTIKYDDLPIQIKIVRGVTLHLSGIALKDSITPVDFILNEGTLTLDRCLITGNTVTAQHGGIRNLGTLMLRGCAISGNTLKPSDPVDAFGGGISNSGGTVILNNSTISGNTVIASQGHSADGGGISNDKGGQIILEQSNVSNNVVTGSEGSGGGGIYNTELTDNNSNTSKRKSTITLKNSTISENRVISDKGISQGGGGILVNGGEGTITSCTIYGNAATSSDSSGGGIRVTTDPVPQNHIALSHSIVAHNHAATGPDLSGSVVTNGYNLIQDFSGITFDNPLNLHETDLSGASFPTLGIDPQLKNNSRGPNSRGRNDRGTLTHALLPGSPAIDRIPLSACDKTIDQRGVERPQGSSCDIGAYEYNPTKNT